MEVEVRRLTKPEELVEVVEVHASAWGSRDYREVAPAHVLRALVDNGGLVLGAFINGKMVGASYGWVVCEGGERYFYSHATGVAEGYKYRGVGYALKLKQREEVLRMGIKLIKWTFDPLQSLNSRFNLRKLGVVYREYYVNYYGEMTDAINRGLGSDRVKAEWWIASRLVEAKLSGSLTVPGAGELVESYGAEVAVLNEGGLPRVVRDSSEVGSEIALIALPRSISEVRDRFGVEAAARWREATRRVLRGLLRRGYIAVDYAEGKGSGYVVLVKRSLGEVLEGKLPWARR
ncbi:MAG: hypothetical protein F7B17_01425 [Desulfurococcales archaeon]|nr:hypothetical protein [Desulfurococcales archaeon]